MNTKSYSKEAMELRKIRDALRALPINIGPIGIEDLEEIYSQDDTR